MKYDYYRDIDISPDFEQYDFTSEGARGVIRKRISFDYIQEPGLYNLAFGDVTTDGAIDDYSISDNKDMSKVLATIAAVVKLFLEKYPGRIIFFRGSTAERTRLYRMAISVNLSELSTFYTILGMLPDGEVVNFEKNLLYEAFLISKKS